MKSAAFFSPSLLCSRGKDTRTREARASASAVRCNSVPVVSLKLNDV